MSEQGFDLSAIKELIAAVEKHGIQKLELKQNDNVLKIEGRAVLPVVAPAPAVVSELPPVVIEQQQEATGGTIVTSPIVGTFYASPGPDQAPYIQCGSQVAVGDTLFIIESMKLMNEITSEVAGTVREILVTDGQTVEYGEHLVIID